MNKQFFDKFKKAWEDYEIGQVFINGRAYHGKHPIKESLKGLLYWMLTIAIVILVLNLFSPL